VHLVLCMSRPFLRDAGTTRKADASVDDEQFAVHGVVHATKPGPVRLVELDHFRTCLSNMCR
jgi:hypothetical protein